MIEKQEFGRRIAYYRQARGITQKELAEKVNVSCQAVSRWEVGKCFPAIDILYEIAMFLNVTVEQLLVGNAYNDRNYAYKSVGLDTTKLYTVKDELLKYISEDERLVYSHYKEPLMYKINLSDYNDPVLFSTLNVPGSKAKFSKEYGLHENICFDVVARAINNVVKYGADPFLLQAHVVCGDWDNNQFIVMGQSLKQACEESGVTFAGLDIAAQPVNHSLNDYELFVELLGVADNSQLILGDSIKAGDMLIAIASPGIDATSYPFVKIIFEQESKTLNGSEGLKNELAKKVLEPNVSYANVIKELRKNNQIHGICRVENSIIKDTLFKCVPHDLGVEIDLSSIPVNGLYKLLIDNNLIEKESITYKFSLGIGMIVIVSKHDENKTINIIKKFHDCFVIGEIKEKRDNMAGKIYVKGAYAGEFK